MTIILNKHMRNGRSYKKESTDNTNELKKLMEKLIIQESETKSNKEGGGVWRGQFKKQENEKKRVKTFKL